jgi:serine protease Do
MNAGDRQSPIVAPEQGSAAEPGGALELPPPTADAAQPARLDQAIQAELPLAMPRTVDLPAAPVAPARNARREPHASWLLPCLCLFAVVLAGLYAAPYLIYHWRALAARADAEAFFEKRRAELRAEAEHADERLAVLDGRVELASLGFREVIRKVSPWVVNVANYREPRADEHALAKKVLFRDPDDDRTYVQEGVGSGLIVKPGVILTNHHVVRGATRLRLTVPSGQSITLSTDNLLVDGITDLAVMRLPDDLPDAIRRETNVQSVFADSDKHVHVGDFALAVGSPLGLRHTVTQGVISAKGRQLHLLDLVELLQTDAPINPGNSGGPLFDQLGRVVGINVAIASDNGGNQGIGFAIPSNTVRKICDHLLAAGEVPRGYLGVALAEVSGPLARRLNLEAGGVLVREVLPGDPGARSGLRVGDVIVGLDREPLHAVQPVRHLRQLIVDQGPGSQITLSILRDGAPREVPVQVGKRPADLP